MTRSGGQVRAMWEAARAVARSAPSRHPASRPLPPLLFFTDPQRTPDPVAVAEQLPSGAGIVFRHFGAPDAEAVGRALAATARRRGLVLLVGDDARLAAMIRAAGVHLPERACGLAPRLRARRPHWLVTVAAHSARALASATSAGCDAAVLSAVFPSRSPSAGVALGPLRAAMLVRDAGLPVYALGGVNARTARRLRENGFAGLAAIEGLTPETGCQRPTPIEA